MDALVIIFWLLILLGSVGIYLSLTWSPAVALNLRLHRHRRMDPVTINLGVPQAFHIAPTDANNQEAPVSDIAWTIDDQAGTLMPFANNYGATYTPGAAGTFNLGVSAKSAAGVTLSDGCVVTVIDNTPPPTPEAVKLNLALGQP